MKVITIGFLENKVGKDDAETLYDKIARAVGAGSLSDFRDFQGGLPPLQIDEDHSEKVEKLLAGAVKAEEVEIVEKKAKKEGNK